MRQEDGTTPQDHGLRSQAPMLGAAPLVSEDELARRFTQRLRVFASRQLRDPAVAEDVAQETLHHVIEALRANRIADLAALPAFVYQTARNLCMHRIRSAVREQLAFARYQHDAPASTEGSDALSALISAERAATVRAALAGLSDGDRELLALTYYDGLDAERVGARLGIAPAAVRVRKHRALRRLAALLRGFGNESAAPGTP